jgi:hypothetical protein
MLCGPCLFAGIVLVRVIIITTLILRRKLLDFGQREECI